MLTINVCLHTATAVTSHRAVLDQQPAERLCSSTRRWSLPWGIANLDSVLIDLIVTFIILLRDSCSFVTVMMTCCHALVCEAQVLACCCAVEKISAQAAEQPRPVLRSTSGRNAPGRSPRNKVRPYRYLVLLLFHVGWTGPSCASLNSHKRLEIFL